MRVPTMTEALAWIKFEFEAFRSQLTVCTLKLLTKIVVLQIVEALVIVACTRVYVKGGYAKSSLYEVVFVTQWFVQHKIGVEDDRTRKWSIGFPAYVLGGVVGCWLGLWLS